VGDEIRSAATSSTPDGGADPLVGTVLADRYRVLSPIGRGGMGAVYRVEHLTLKKELAVKLLHPELSRLDEIARRFEREAEAAARLDHPNIVTVTDFGRTPDGLLFLVMELLDGPSLAQVIRPGLDGHEPGGGPGRPMAPARALGILRQILRALAEAHGRGIVHRDLKPENVVLIERDGQPDWVKIIDFGIAKITAPGVTPRPGEALTAAGVVFGTPEYLSPEQAMGEEADGRADLYAAGVMLFEMLTGRRPFEASSRVEILSMHLVHDPPSVRSIVPDADVTPEIEALVRRAMAKKRDDRFQDATAFLVAVDQALGLDAPPSPARRTSEPFAAASVPDPQPSVPPAATLARRALSLFPSTFRFLVERTREAGVPHPRAAVAAALAVVLVLTLAGTLVVRARLRPSPPALAPLLQRVEAMLARGEMEPARTALQQLIVAYPQAARVHYLYGNLNYADGERDRAMGDYMRAIERDPSLAKDSLLRGNARACLERRGTEAQAALTLLVDKVGEPALADLVWCAKSCRDERIRRRAAEAALKLGGPNALGPSPSPSPSPPLSPSPSPSPSPSADEPKPAADDKPDPHQALLDQLAKGRSCRDRKRAAVALIATGEPRYRDALERARARRGGFLGLQEVNACMRRELDAYLRSTDPKK
jgi:serine/threonine protein kinase